MAINVDTEPSSSPTTVLHAWGCRCASCSRQQGFIAGLRVGEHADADAVRGNAHAPD